MDINAQGGDLVWRASEIDKATECPRKLGYSRLGFVEEPGAPPTEVGKEFSWALIAGLAMDDTLSEDARRQIAGQPDMELDEFFIYSLGKNEQQCRREGTLNEEPGERDAVVNDGAGVLNVYKNGLRKHFKFTGVQTLCETTVAGTRLVGHIDYTRQTSSGQIIGDWKFTKKTVNQMPASTYVRGHAYDLMHGDGTGQIELVLLRRGLKTPKIETSSHFVTEGERNAVRRQVATLTEMYRQRHFPMASPASWACSPQWCGFWTVCRGHKDGPRPIPGEKGVQA